MNFYFVTAAVLALAIGLAHSWLGERYILIRLFRRQNIPHLFGSDDFTKHIALCVASYDGRVARCSSLALDIFLNSARFFCSYTIQVHCRNLFCKFGCCFDRFARTSSVMGSISDNCGSGMDG